MESKIAMTEQMRQNIQKAADVEGSARRLSRLLGYTPSTDRISYLTKNAKTISTVRYRKVLMIIGVMKDEDSR